MPSAKNKTQTAHISIADAAIALSVSKATIRNWVKAGLLSSPVRGYISTQSLADARQTLIGKSKLIARANKSQKSQETTKQSKLATIGALQNAFDDDTISQKYENTLTESHRNKEGIYYTSSHIVGDMLKNINIDHQTTFLDPCCGCGNFIIEAINRGIAVENIYGYDTDPTAVEITKRRIFQHTGKHAQNILCGDFLTIAQHLDRKFDLIYTNPPWGKKLSETLKAHFATYYKTGKSKDTCSLFFFAAIGLLAKQGTVGFLLPESVLNIATFQPLRALLLSLTIKEIKNYGKAFKGIQSRAYAIIANNSTPKQNHKVQCHEQQAHLRLQSSFLDNPRQILNSWTNAAEQDVISRLFSLPHHTLKGNALWAMGIVTGNNKKHCKAKPEQGLVPIFKGKDISPNHLAAPTTYISPDLSKYQQAASPTIYYADTKLIYRFISNRLTFFCDTEQRLILNSANALVLNPDFPLAAPQVATLLNSKIINWIFLKLFRTHKILRTDLEQLPLFPSPYTQDTFNEPSFLEENNIAYTNGTYSIKT